jgi:NTE family protein
MSALTTRIIGTDNLFRPRTWPAPLRRFESLYDLSPLRTRLSDLVDFDTLNAGQCRVSVTTTEAVRR